MSFPYSTGKDQVVASIQIHKKNLFSISNDYEYGMNRSYRHIPVDSHINIELEMQEFQEKDNTRWKYRDDDRQENELSMKSG